MRNLGVCERLYAGGAQSFGSKVLGNFTTMAEGHACRFIAPQPEYTLETINIIDMLCEPLFGITDANDDLSQRAFRNAVCVPQSEKRCRR